MRLVIFKTQYILTSTLAAIGGVTTYFVGAHYELTGAVVTKYYFAGTQRIAMRKGAILTYMLSGHLGSTSLATDSAGNVISELRYKPWGEVRYQAGTTSTSYTYTGQYSNTADFGLMFYNARWYDSYLNWDASPKRIRLCRVESKGMIGMRM